MKVFSTAILSVLLLGGYVFSQSNKPTIALTVRDGLSSNVIRDIMQDKYGYIWIATKDGLNKYDGYKIIIYKKIPGDSTSLPSNVIFKLFEDSYGTLWISTDDGLARYNRNLNTFSTYRHSKSTSETANRVIQIFEDSRKKMWVETPDGTQEFNREKGKFSRYDVMRTDNSIARFPSYAYILENKKGELYCISGAYGLMKFDYKTSLFIQIPLKDNFNNKLIRNYIFTALFDDSENLWIGFTAGLAKIDVKNNQGIDITPFKKRAVQTLLLDNSVTNLMMDKNKNIWIGTGRNGMFLYSNRNKKIEQIIPESSTLYYLGFFEDNSGLLWFGSTRGILKYDSNRKPFEFFSFSNDVEGNRDKFVLNFSNSLNNSDHIWLATAKGVSAFNTKNNSIIRNPVGTLSKLNDLKISAVQEDSGHKLWISTAIDGLYTYDLNAVTLKNFKHKKYDSSSITDNRINTLILDREKNLWIGTQVGLNLLKKSEGSFVHIPSFLNRRYDINLLAAINKLRKENVPLSSIIGVGDNADLSKEFVVRNDTKAIVCSMGEGDPTMNMADFGWLVSAKGDTLWSASEFNESFQASGALKNRLKIGLVQLKTGRYKLRYKSDGSHSAASFNQTPPQDSLYWGIQLFTLSDDQYNNMLELVKKSEAKTYLEGENIQVIFPDRSNRIWVGTTNGLSKIDTAFTIENYQNIAQDKNSLSNNIIHDIDQDLAGNIWIATSDGLNMLDLKTKKFKVFTELDGLPSSNVSAIEVDNEGNLWVSSIKGISKIELSKEDSKQIIVNYDVKDGLQGYEFIPNSSYKDKSGKLYFAGFDGFNAFYPGSSNKTPPSLVFQDIKISNTSISKLDQFGHPDINQLQQLSLTHSQNDLSFEFASIHFSRPDKNRLMHKMDGVDHDWIRDDRRFASYTNLSPGDYTFNFRGSNGDGIWNDETKKINIHIAAAWYNNQAAYTVYALIFLGLLFSIRRIEINRQQKNARIRESQLRVEAAELKAQAAEAQAKVIQAENERKTKELEEARALQLSMLPKKLPQLSHLDIAVYMQTATEVGGDYYDFHVGMDGTLTVVIGDATGHGMKAGTMVTTAKSLFNSYAPNPDILYSFQEITRCIKQMNFGKLSMCMTMVKIMGDKMQISSAGMPPSFIFRRDTQVVEEHLFKAMPLGTMEKFPYEIKDTMLKTGDTVLLLSDGLPELKNKNNEMYGYQRIRNGFENMAEKAPEEIVSYLKNEGAGWVNNAAPDDDVTFVVIKVK